MVKKDKQTYLKPVVKKEKVGINYDITLAVLGLGIIIMLIVMIVAH